MHTEMSMSIQRANKLQWECWFSFVLRSELAKISTCFTTLIVLLEDCIFMIPSQVLSFTMNLELNNKLVSFKKNFGRKGCMLTLCLPLSILVCIFNTISIQLSEIYTQCFIVKTEILIVKCTGFWVLTAPKYFGISGKN